MLAREKVYHGCVQSQIFPMITRKKRVWLNESSPSLSERLSKKGWFCDAIKKNDTTLVMHHANQSKTGEYGRTMRLSIIRIDGVNYMISCGIEIENDEILQKVYIMNWSISGVWSIALSFRIDTVLGFEIRTDQSFQNFRLCALIWWIITPKRGILCFNGMY